MIKHISSKIVIVTRKIYSLFMLLIIKLPIYFILSNNTLILADAETCKISNEKFFHLAPHSNLSEVIVKQKELLLLNQYPNQNLPIDNKLFSYIRNKKLRLYGQRNFTMIVLKFAQKWLPQDFHNVFFSLENSNNYSGLQNKLSILSNALAIAETELKYNDALKNINKKLLQKRIVLSVMFHDLHLLLSPEGDSEISSIWFDLVDKKDDLPNSLKIHPGDEILICEIIREINSENKKSNIKSFEAQIIHDAIILHSSNRLVNKDKLLTFGGVEVNQQLFPVKKNLQKYEKLIIKQSDVEPYNSFEKEFLYNENLINNGMILSENEQKLFLNLFSLISENSNNKELLNDSLNSTTIILRMMVEELGITDPDFLTFAFINYTHKYLKYDLKIFDNLSNSGFIYYKKILNDRPLIDSDVMDVTYLNKILNEIKEEKDQEIIVNKTQMIIFSIIEKVFQLRQLNIAYSDNNTLFYFSTISYFISRFIDNIDLKFNSGKYKLLLEDVTLMLSEQILLTGRALNFLNKSYMIKYSTISSEALLTTLDENFQIKINKILEDVNSSKGKKYRQKKHIKWFDRRIKFLMPERYIRRNHLKLVPIINKLDQLYPELKSKISITGNLQKFFINDYINSLHYFCEVLAKGQIKNWKEFEKYFVEFQYRTNKKENDDVDISGYSFNKGSVEDIHNILKSIFRKKESNDPVRFAAEKFVEIVKFQPFHNGNHRTADFVLNFILLKHGLPFFCITEENIGEYYRLLNNKDLFSNNYSITAITEFFRREIDKNSWMHLITTSYSLNTKIFANKYQVLKSKLLLKPEIIDISLWEKQLGLTREEIYRSIRYFEPIIGEFVNIIDSNGKPTNILKKYTEEKEAGGNYAKVNVLIFNSKGKLLRFDESNGKKIKGHFIQGHLLLGEDHFEGAIRNSLDKIGVFIDYNKFQQVDLPIEIRQTGEKLFIYQLEENEELLIKQNKELLEPMSFIDFHKEFNDMSMIPDQFEPRSKDLIFNYEIRENILKTMHLPLQKEIEYTIEELLERNKPIKHLANFDIYYFDVNKASGLDLGIISNEIESFINDYFSPFSPYQTKNSYNLIISNSEKTGSRQDDNIFININDISNYEIIKKLLINNLYFENHSREHALQFYNLLKEHNLHQYLDVNEEKNITLIINIYWSFFHHIVYESNTQEQLVQTYPQILEDVLKKMDNKLKGTTFELAFQELQETFINNMDIFWKLFSSNFDILREFQNQKDNIKVSDYTILQAINRIMNSKADKFTEEEIDKATEILNTPIISKPFNEKRKKVFYLSLDKHVYNNSGLKEFITEMFSYQFHNNYNVTSNANSGLASFSLKCKAYETDKNNPKELSIIYSDQMNELIAEVLIIKKIFPVILLAFDDSVELNSSEFPLASLLRNNFEETIQQIFSSYKNNKQQNELITPSILQKSV